jgi:hypothetical protein
LKRKFLSALRLKQKIARTASLHEKKLELEARYFHSYKSILLFWGGVGEGSQIGRFFALMAVVYFPQFLGSKNLGENFSTVQVTY